MDRSVTAYLWGMILVWVVRAVSATDACTPSRPTRWPVSSVRAYGSMEALSTIRTVAGRGRNEVHRLECCVRRASWRWYPVSGIIPDGGAARLRYHRRSSGSSMMGSSYGMASTSPSIWSAIAVMQLETAPVETVAFSVSRSIITTVSSSALWALS